MTGAQSEAEAMARVREWVETEADDWYDPVLSPELIDAFRVVVGLPPIDRSEDDE